MSMYDWNHYLNEIQQTNQYLLQKTKQLEERINQLETSQKENNHTTVEKIEYKFDQLKIEHLEGTLHVGLSPNDLSNVENLDFGNNGTVPMKKMNPNPTSQQQPSLIAKLNKYVHEDVPPIVQNLAKEYNHPMDSDYENMLLLDIETQLPQRITFYEREARGKQIPNPEIPSYIYEQIKKEISHSIATYMKTNRKEGDTE